MTAKRATSFDVCLGEAVRRRRQARTVTQESLAICLGISFQQIQKYEAGTNRIAAGRLVEIAEALACRPEELLAGIPTKAVPIAAPRLEPAP